MPPITDALDDAIYSSNALEVAADDNYAVQGDAKDGTPVKVTPSVGELRQSFRPERQMPAQHLNWLLRQFALFMGQLHGDTETLRQDLIDELDDRRDEWMERWGQIQAFNFPTRVDLETSNIRRATFAAGTWFCTISDTIWASIDGGLTWAQDTAAAIAPKQIESDPSGNVVACGTGGAGQYVYEYDAGSETWTQRTVLGGHDGDGHAVFDPIRNIWIWQSTDSGTGDFVAKRSSDRVTWSLGSVAPAWGCEHDVSDLAINPSNGRAVAVAKASASSVKVATTDDGGDIWAAQTPITTAIDATELGLSYNEEEGAWYLCIGEDGDPSSEVWRSTDGASWSRRCTLTESQVHRIAGIGRLLVALGTNGSGPQVVYSLDLGVTWKKTGRILEGLGSGAFLGGGRPIALTSTMIYVGLALGDPDLGTLP